MAPLQKDNELLTKIKSQLPELEALLDEMSSHWFYEDSIYRFYHQSFKVYGLQEETRKIVEALKSVAPEGAAFCKEFEEIYLAGASGKPFEMAHNRNWTAHTRVFVEAFFHAKFFLEMAVKYGKELEQAPASLPSGWAALLCLYNLR
jgi:hypothetical protein